MRSESASRADVHTLLDLMRRINSSARTAEVLAEIVRCVHDDLGFGAVSLASRVGGRLVTTNVVGPPEAVEALLGQPLRDAFIESERLAEPLGLLRWVPAERVTDDILAGAWTPPPLDHPVEPGEWDPRDLLFAPLVSATGDLVGRLSVDLPPGGRFPDAALRRRLELFVVQAGWAISHAEQRAELGHRVRLAETVRDLADATAAGTLAQRLSGAAQVVARAFGARQCLVWCRAEGPDLPAVSVGFPHPGGDDADDALLADLAGRDLGAPPIELRAGDPTAPELPRSLPAMTALLERLDSRHLVVLPFGADGEQLGHLLLARPGEDLLGRLEGSTLADVARHLGTVVYSQRQLARERRLAAELTELARYKAELIATISHELRTPLTSILGHVELLAEDDPGPSVEVIEECAHELDALVAGLLDDARRPVAPVLEQIDLVPLCRAALDRRQPSAARAGLTLTLEHPGRVVADADPLAIGRLVEALVGDAVLHSRPGGRVVLTLAPADEAGAVELRVADDGGAVPGLAASGLAPARRVVEAHGGELDLDPGEGGGRTVSVRLPARRDSPPASG